LTLSYITYIRLHPCTIFLSQVNPDIENIVVESTNVAVYQFDTANTKWNRVGVEGGAFVVQASSEPRWSFIILNRAGPDNFVLDISSLIKVKLQPPYLMLRCSTNGAPCIYGLWFHDSGERDVFVVQMDKCMALAKQARAAAAPAPTPAPAAPVAAKPVVAKSVASTASVSSTATVAPPAVAPPAVAVKQETASPAAKAVAGQSSPQKVESRLGGGSSSIISISEVSSRLLSPSDITGKERRFVKRSA
jgi:hypothetical protein